MTKLPIGVMALALFCANAFAQPVGAKLDHVVIAVHDLEAAKKLYSGLGFSIPSDNGRHPGYGTDDSEPSFNDGYLELLTPYDTSLPVGRELAEHLKKGDGAIAAGLQIASAERTARDLRAAGMKINGPTPGTITRLGDKEPPRPGWWLITFGRAQIVDPLMASRPVFLIEYATRPAATGPVAPESDKPTNPNSASSLSAVLIAVNDVQKAVVEWGKIGNANDKEIRLPEFGLSGKRSSLKGAKYCSCAQLIPPVPRLDGSKSVEKEFLR
jgi:catechol 2,3-dioxygenase-like lactoylglutathione lyase family enzyme